MNAARGSPHPRKEDLARLPKCRGLLDDDADIQRRRQRPPPQGVVDSAAVDSFIRGSKKNRLCDGNLETPQAIVALRRTPPSI